MAVSSAFATFWSLWLAAGWAFGSRAAAWSIGVSNKSRYELIQDP
jgi:hypothetical protein